MADVETSDVVMESVDEVNEVNAQDTVAEGEVTNNETEPMAEVEASGSVLTSVENTTVTEEVIEATKDEKLYKFPLGRVKTIMKLDPDVTMASQEAVFAITKAIELFVESLAVEAYSYTSASKKKTISKADVETAIDNVDCLAFLDGAMDD